MKTKKIMLLALLVVATLFVMFLVKPSKVISEEVAPVPPEIVKLATPQELVLKYAKEYNVSAPLIKEIINLENREWNEKRQSGIIYKFSDPKRGIVKGEREKSYGLAQIHLPDHPKITYEQATSADFAIKFIASEISQGRGWQWSCYRTAKYNIANGKSGGECTL